MKSNSIFVAALAAAGLASLSPAALAQNPPPTPLRGKIAAVDGHTVAVTTRNGDKVSVKLADPVSVSTVKPVDIATVKSGDFVGIAAEPKGKDASRALEVLVFPESMRGAGEGHYGARPRPFVQGRHHAHHGPAGHPGGDVGAGAGDGPETRGARVPDGDEAGGRDVLRRADHGGHGGGGAAHVRPLLAQQ